MSLSERKVTIGSVAVAFISLITAIVTNLDKIELAFCKIPGMCARRPDPAGQWTGLFREERDSRSGPFEEIISREVLNIRSLSGGQITGTIMTSSQATRVRSITSGSFHVGSGVEQKSIILINSVGDDPDRGGLGGFTYFLRGQLEGGRFFGYWTGWDPDGGKIMTCPYFMTRRPRALPEDANGWLDQPCNSNSRPIPDR